MGLIVVQRQGARVVAVGGIRGGPGVGIASVVIRDDKHLIVTLTNGTEHDAGVLPSSDEVETLAQHVAELADRVASLEEGGSTPTIPADALTDPSGALLTDANGQTLILGPLSTQAGNELTTNLGDSLTDDELQVLTAGEVV